MTVVTPDFFRCYSACMSSPDTARKLTTILAADVVGYGRIMAENEEGALEILRAYRSVFETFVTKHDGRIFNTGGDAILAEFGSAVEAVRCAVSIQEELATRNAQLAENRQMWFRIGINVGDVIFEQGDLFGDGVNIAARLEGLADKGGICISGSTFEQVKNKLSVGFADIGPQVVKNIPEPIPAFRLVSGQVSVKASGELAQTKGTVSKQTAWYASSRQMIVVAVAAVAAGGIVAWVLATRSPSVYAYDGRWKVSVHSRSGCLNNDPASYSVVVRNGMIEEPAHRFPKKGSVSAHGAFKIEVSSQDGRPMNVQEGTINGDTGEGQFIGAKPGCEGKVLIQRAG